MDILLADDHPLILEGLANMLVSALPEVRIFKAKDKEELYEQLRQQHIDILFQDIRFGKHDAREFIAAVMAEYPNLKVIIITSVAEPTPVETLLKQGVSAYLLKSDEKEDVLNAIEAVMAGDTYLSAGLQELLQGRRVRTRQIPLTPREKEVLQLILQEKTTREISDLIFLSEKTVENHRSNLFLKFEVKNMAGLVRRAILEGYL